MSDQAVEKISESSPLHVSEFLNGLKNIFVQKSPRQEVDTPNLSQVNSLINTGILLLIGIAVLSKVAMVDQEIMRGWTTEEIAYRIPIDNWLTYNEVLNREPVFTKAVTSATVYTIGDIISQKAEGKGIGEMERWRVVRSMLAGLIGHGPLSHVWYNVSEDLFNQVLHWTAWWSFFPKVVLDQAAWGPFWNNTYILLLGLMKRESFESIWDDIKRTTIPLVISGLKLWPLAHCVTYGLIPIENRLLWVDIVEIFWVVILATQAASGTNDIIVDNVESNEEKCECTDLVYL